MKMKSHKQLRHHTTQIIFSIFSKFRKQKSAPPGYFFFKKLERKPSKRHQESAKASDSLKIKVCFSTYQRIRPTKNLLMEEMSYY